MPDANNSDALFGALTRPRAFEEIIDQIEQAIATGRLNPGDRLPAERELSELFGVSRSSVREAMRVLEMFGAIEAKPGRGPTSGSIVAGDARIGLKSALRLHTALLRVPVRDIVGVRVLIETQSAHDAALAADEDDVARMRAVIAEMREATEVREANALDTAFHAEVAQASGNGFTPALLEGIREAMVRDMLQGFTRLEDWRVEFALAADEHDAIVGHIERRDADLAAQAMRSHVLRLFEEVVAKGGEPGLPEARPPARLGRRD